MQHGVSIKLKKVPSRVQLFKVVAPQGDIDWIITNSDALLTSDDVQDEDAKRWLIKQLHRELKQLTGIEKCQCRKQRAQHNHLACCYQAWLAIKVKADCLGQTLYATVNDSEQRCVIRGFLLWIPFRSESPKTNTVDQLDDVEPVETLPAC